MTTQQGFAIRRNGTCFQDVETDCGATRAPFRGCCPVGYACPSQYNIACCLSGTNCTDTILAVPTVQEVRCANATWDLFDNGGYFCCEHGLRGYNNQNTNGCAIPGAPVPSGIKWLSTIRTGTVESATPSPSLPSPSLPSSATATASTSFVSTPSSLPTAASRDSSSTNVGAIAGGVVGGVVGLALVAFLAWFFLRKKRQNKPAHPYADGQHRYEADADVDALPVKYRHDASAAVYEVDGASPGARSELAANEQKPVELAGQQSYRA